MRWKRDRQGRPTFDRWRGLFVAGLAVFLSGPAQTYGVSPFVEPMPRELGRSRSLFSSAYSIGTLVSAGALILAGRQIGRVGNRRVLSVAAVGFGGALLLLSVASYALAILAGFALLRTCGFGVLGLGTRTLVPFWFVRHAAVPSASWAWQARSDWPPSRRPTSS